MNNSPSSSLEYIYLKCLFPWQEGQLAHHGGRIRTYLAQPMVHAPGTPPWAGHGRRVLKPLKASFPSRDDYMCQKQRTSISTLLGKRSIILHPFSLLSIPRNMSRTELGFLVSSEEGWRIWDCAKFGGKPFWLIPDAIPECSDLTCPYCQKPLCFMLQLYNPCEENPDAYHRCIYVFVCQNQDCLEKAR